MEQKSWAWNLGDFSRLTGSKRGVNFSGHSSRNNLKQMGKKQTTYSDGLKTAPNETGKSINPIADLNADFSAYELMCFFIDRRIAFLVPASK
jgi:hypothetical protein